MSVQLANMELPETQPSLRIYQPYLDAGQQAELDDDAVGFDMTFNTAPDSREYELFKALQKKEAAADPRDFWGLVSRKFNRKSPINFSEFRKNAEAAMLAGADAYAINPMIGKASLYFTVKEHDVGGGAHPQMAPLLKLAAALGCPVDEPQNHKSFFFCNYFVGNARFWKGYFSLCDVVLERCESEAVLGTEAGKVYAGSGGYFRNMKITTRPFFIERLFGYYVQLATRSGLKIESYRPGADDFELKFGRQVGPLLHSLFEEKEAFLESGDRDAIKKWVERRFALVNEPNLVWHLDDPPVWLPFQVGSPRL